MSGDIFVDITRGAYGIFVKYTSCWVEWAGVKKCDGFGQHIIQTTHPPLFHPHNKKLTIWCTKKDITWIPHTALVGARHTLFVRHTGQSIISAGEMVEETTVLARKISAMYDKERKRLLVHTPIPLAINIRHAAFHHSTSQVESSTTFPIGLCTVPLTVYGRMVTAPIQVMGHP